MENELLNSEFFKSLPEDVKEKLMKSFLTLKLPGGKENKGKVIFLGEYTE